MNIDQTLNIVEEVLDGNTDYTEIELVEALQILDDHYFNEIDVIEDSQYDIFRNYVKRCFPSNIYFYGVGSTVRGGKVTLPHTTPSLNQIKFDMAV